MRRVSRLPSRGQMAPCCVHGSRGTHRRLCMDVGWAPTWRVGAALHRGPRLLSSEASRPAWALAVGPAPGRPPVCVPRGGVSRPWPMHVAVSVVSRGKGTAARGVFSGAAPAATCGRVLPSLEMEEEGVSSPPQGWSLQAVWAGDQGRPLGQGPEHPQEGHRHGVPSRPDLREGRPLGP